MTEPRAYAEPKFREPGTRCYACSACQSVLRDREEVMRQLRGGNHVEVLGPEPECLRVVEERKQAARMG